MKPRSEQFSHGADVGIRGIGGTKETAFEQVAHALSEVVTEAEISPSELVEIECSAPTDSLLLVDWLNRLIYEMAVRHMVFGRYSVTIQGGRLFGRAWGETVDRARHAPSVEPKGATLTELGVKRRRDGSWIAQCVIDV